MQIELSFINFSFESIFRNNFLWWYLLILSIVTDPKSGDARASFGYLLQQLTEEYNQKMEHEKVKIRTASHTGFYGKTYILDQYNQVDLASMEVVDKESLVMLESKEKDEIDFLMR